MSVATGDQASKRQRLADTLRDIGREFGELADKTASPTIREFAQGNKRAAEWLEGKAKDGERP